MKQPLAVRNRRLVTTIRIRFDHYYSSEYEQHIRPRYEYEANSLYSPSLNFVLTSIISYEILPNL